MKKIVSKIGEIIGLPIIGNPVSINKEVCGEIIAYDPHTGEVTIEVADKVYEKYMKSRQTIGISSREIDNTKNLWETEANLEFILGRFWVDQRLGCVAVRDMMHPQHSINVLNAHAPDVICYFEWERKNKMSPDCHSFEENQKDIDKCHSIANHLNDMWRLTIKPENVKPMKKNDNPIKYAGECVEFLKSEEVLGKKPSWDEIISIWGRIASHSNIRDIIIYDEPLYNDIAYGIVAVSNGLFKYHFFVKPNEDNTKFILRLENWGGKYEMARINLLENMGINCDATKKENAAMQSEYRLVFESDITKENYMQLYHMTKLYKENAIEKVKQELSYKSVIIN